MHLVPQIRATPPLLEFFDDAVGRKAIHAKDLAPPSRVRQTLYSLPQDA
jgi:hypothetical protein